MHAYIYCQGRLKRYWNGLMGFRAKCWVTGWTPSNGVEWIDTPQTVMTTRAPAVLKKNMA